MFAKTGRATSRAVSWRTEFPCAAGAHLGCRDFPAMGEKHQLRVQAGPDQTVSFLSVNSSPVNAVFSERKRAFLSGSRSAAPGERVCLGCVESIILELKQT